MSMVVNAWVTCVSCKGTGRHRAGDCYRCDGKGVQSPGDQRRNRYYDRKVKPAAGTAPRPPRVTDERD